MKSTPSTVPEAPETVTMDQIIQSIQYALERFVLDRDPVLRTAEEALTAPLTRVRLFQVEEVRLSPEADVRSSLESVLAGFQGQDVSMIYIAKKTGASVQLYLGVLDPSPNQVHDGEKLGNAAEVLAGSIRGAYPGTTTSAILYGNECQSLVGELAQSRYAMAITGIPSVKRSKEPSRGIERVLDSLGDQNIALVTVAEPISRSRLQSLLSSVREYWTQVHPYVKATSQQQIGSQTGQTVNINQSGSVATTESRALGSAEQVSVTNASTAGQGSSLSESESDGLSTSKGYQESTGRSSSQSTVKKADLPERIAKGIHNFFAGGHDPSASLSESASASAGSTTTGSRSRTSQVSDTRSWQESRTATSGESFTASDTTTTGETHTTSIQYGKALSESAMQSTTLGTERVDRSARHFEEVLEKLHKRFLDGQGTGLWNVSTFVLGENKYAVGRAAQVLQGHLAGAETSLEPLRIVEVGSDSKLMGSICAFGRLRCELPEPHPLDPCYDDLATLLTTAELSCEMGMPGKSLPGLDVVRHCDFGRFSPPAKTDSKLELGHLVDRNVDSRILVELDIDNLVGHTFITGVTDSGKTTTCRQLLRGLWNRGIPFLVIEPSKTEYRRLVNEIPDLILFSIGGNQSVAPFRLNPFNFIEPTPLTTHIDRLKATFNAAFPMYASMPVLLEEALFTVYIERGWNLFEGTNQFVVSREDKPLFLPTLSDLLPVLETVVEAKGYDIRLRMDLTAALKTRIGSLTRGAKGAMFDTRTSVDFVDLLKKPVLIELDLVGDDNEKAFFMGLVLSFVREACLARGLVGSTVNHVTVIEEAHRLLKHTSEVQVDEAANIRGQAVESFSNMLAEVRAYGESLVVVDQIPTKLIPDAIKNTNVKIVHRLMARDDRDAVGDAIGLTVEQKDELVHLSQGIGVYHNRRLRKAILVKVPRPSEKPNGLDDGLDAKIASRLKVFRENNRNSYLGVAGAGWLERPELSLPLLKDKAIPEKIEAAFDQVVLLVAVAQEKILDAWEDYSELCEPYGDSVDGIMPLSSFLCERFVERTWHYLRSANLGFPYTAYDRNVRLRENLGNLFGRIDFGEDWEDFCGVVSTALQECVPESWRLLELFTYGILLRGAPEFREPLDIEIEKENDWQIRLHAAVDGPIRRLTGGWVSNRDIVTQLRVILARQLLTIHAVKSLGALDLIEKKYRAWLEMTGGGQ
jgi:hypothetical protein